MQCLIKNILPKKMQSAFCVPRTPISSIINREIALPVSKLQIINIQNKNAVRLQTKHFCDPPLTKTVTCAICLEDEKEKKCIQMCDCISFMHEECFKKYVNHLICNKKPIICIMCRKEILKIKIKQKIDLIRKKMRDNTFIRREASQRSQRRFIFIVTILLFCMIIFALVKWCMFKNTD